MSSTPGQHAGRQPDEQPGEQPDEQQSTRDAVGRPPRVLCVCEGNVCRSPVAELLFADLLGPGVELTSAGTRALVGAPVAPPMAALLHGRSIDSDAFRARQLERAHLRAADLVLTLTRRQRRQAVELVPSVVRHTFTLRELARLLAEVDPAGLPSGTALDRVRQASVVGAARRSFVADPQDDDVADPYGLHERDYRRAFDIIADAVARIGPFLGPAAAREGQSTAGSVSRAEVAQSDEGGPTTRDAASAST